MKIVKRIWNLVRAAYWRMQYADHQAGVEYYTVTEPNKFMRYCEAQEAFRYRLKLQSIGIYV